jgi:hypothetical protein
LNALALRPNEWEQIIGSFSEATMCEGPDSTTLVTLPEVPLPPGWSASTTTVWFVVPVGYPAAQPDCFWVDADLRLANGSLPSNSGAQSVPVVGAPALWFSWHLSARRPSHDSLITYARFIARRFDDAR